MDYCSNAMCSHRKDRHVGGTGSCSVCKCESYYTRDDVVVNEQGGKQSRLDMDFTEIEPIMLQRVAHVLKQGKDKYGSKNWRNIPYEDHINHMQYHAIMANTDDQSEDHLANVICRAMFAMYMKQVPPIVGGHILNTGWNGPALSPWDTKPTSEQPSASGVYTRSGTYNIDLYARMFWLIQRIDDYAQHHAGDIGPFTKEIQEIIEEVKGD